MVARKNTIVDYLSWGFEKFIWAVYLLFEIYRCCYVRKSTQYTVRSLNRCIYLYIHIHIYMYTHTHTHKYIYVMLVVVVLQYSCNQHL
jgi:hypothetical protein